MPYWTGHLPAGNHALSRANQGRLRIAPVAQKLHHPHAHHQVDDTADHSKTGAHQGNGLGIHAVRILLERRPHRVPARTRTGSYWPHWWNCPARVTNYPDEHANL